MNNQIKGRPVYAMQENPILHCSDFFNTQFSIEIPVELTQNTCRDYPELRGVCVNKFAYHKSDLRFSKQSFGDSNYSLIYCIKGTGTVKTNEFNNKLSPGEFFILKMGEAYDLQPNQVKPWSIVEFAFNGESSLRMLNMFISKNNIPKGFLSYNEERIQLLDGIFKNVKNEENLSHHSIYYLNTCLLYFLSSLIITGHEKSTDKTLEKVNETIEFLKANYTKSITIAELADYVNMSASHFSHIFKKGTGQAPMDYFNHLKMQKACELLSQTNILVKQVAYKLGIEDSNYFTKMFSKIMGVTPNEYRMSRTAA